jgi:polysaccharide biosynthesis protein PelB
LQELSAPLVEALAAAEQTLGKPVQAAEWYEQSLAARPRDFLWTLTLADNMEWAGCPASANHVRFIALRFFASPGFEHANSQYPLRLAEYFTGHRDVLAQRGAWIGPEVSEKWFSLRQNWRLARSLDNADYFSLQRQTERLSSPAWQKFAGAVESKDEKTVALQLKAISGYLEPQSGKKQISDILPLSLEDVDRAQRWLAGKATPGPVDVRGEADICRQTLTKIRGLQRASFILEEQPAL